MLANLSYPLSPATPFWKGLRRPAVEPLYRLERGDLCNSSYLTTSNHAGTHVDGPLHFNSRGRAIGEYTLDELVFLKPFLIDVQAGEAHLIAPADLRLDGVPRDCDMLLLRTGFGHVRREQPDVYVERGPGLSRTAAEHLMRSLPALRSLAVDFISIASTAHEAEGADAHRVLLGCQGYGDRAILLVEDARLNLDLNGLTRVTIVPWMFDGLDSAPCTLIAELP